MGIFRDFYSHFPTFLRSGQFSGIFTFPKQKNLESSKNFPGFLRVTPADYQIPPWIWVARKVPINGKYGFGMSVMGLLMKILNDRILRKGDTAISIITR